MTRNPIVGYVVVAKRQWGDGSVDYQAVSAVRPDRRHVENHRARIAAEAKRAGRDTEYIIGEIRGQA